MQIYGVWGESMRIAEYINGNVIYRDATADEIAEFDRQQAEMPEPEQTTEERLTTLETTTDDIVLMLADIIGGEE